MGLVLTWEKKVYAQAPEGLHQSVCADVVDLGIVDTQYGPKPRVRFVFQTETEDPETHQRYLVFATFGKNLSPKGRLRPWLEAWRGRKLNDAELAALDLEKLVGINAQLQIVHEIATNGNEYANCQAIISCPKTMPKITVKDYVRSKDRQDSAPDDDSEVPF